MREVAAYAVAALQHVPRGKIGAPDMKRYSILSWSHWLIACTRGQRARSGRIFPTRNSPACPNRSNGSAACSATSPWQLRRRLRRRDRQPVIVGLRRHGDDRIVAEKIAPRQQVHAAHLVAVAVQKFLRRQRIVQAQRQASRALGGCGRTDFRLSSTARCP